jgi:hypothetical protein
MSFAIGYEKPFLVSSAFDVIFKKYPLLLFERTSESLSHGLDYFFAHREEYDDISRTLTQERGWSRVAGKTLATYQSITTEGAYEGAQDTITR